LLADVPLIYGIGVVHRFALPLKLLRRPCQRRALQNVVRWARRWISYGASSTEYLLTLGVPRPSILQIQNCVDETTFIPDVEPAERVGPAPVLLYTGQMIGRKGVDRLLDAAAVLQREGRTFSLLLLGDGPEKEVLEARAAELGLRDVHFRPGRSPVEMPAVYRSGDLLVIPKREDAWGLVVNEGF
jgi:glycosyltransferase involved in cell wall biosynthesis